MKFPANAARYIALTALLASLPARATLAQERPAVIQSVDLVVPFSPVTITIDGKPHIVHELHITNFLTVDVSITRLQVIGADSPNTPIADFRDSDVNRILGRPGVRGQSAPQVIGPGMRAVAYFWIALPNGTQPRAVRHRLELDVQRQTGPVRTVVEGALSSISNATPALLDAPLRGGPWVAIYDPLLIGGHRTAVYTLDGRARIPGRFAVDWIRLPASGTMEKTLPRPADWNGYGAEVLAVADGIVASAVDDMPDNDGPPSAAAHRPENSSGNYVAIDIGQGRFAFFEHLQRGSIAVKAGERVKSGQVIARLGSSGSSSIGPHLHFHVSDAPSTLGAEGLPFVFKRFDHLGAFASIEALVGGERWLAHPQPDTVRLLERPSVNSVIRFP